MLTGESNAGKSTLIHKLLQPLVQPVFGFRTEKVDGQDGRAIVYIHAATGVPVYTMENTVGRIVPTGIDVYSSVFNSAGQKYLADIPHGAVVLMDELGFMEAAAPAFCGRVLDILDGPYHVLATVKAADTRFLERVRSHPNALLFEVTVKNRDDLYEQILQQLQRCAPTSPLL